MISSIPHIKGFYLTVSGDKVSGFGIKVGRAAAIDDQSALLLFREQEGPRLPFISNGNTIVVLLEQ